MHARAHGRLKLKRLAVLVGIALPFVAQAQSTEQNAAELPTIKISAQKFGDTTEGTGSYTSGSSKTSTPLSLSLRETPQSVSVITQQRIEDQGLISITDVVNNATGVSVNQYETNRAGFTARGFDVTNIIIDGVPTIYDQAWSAGEVSSSLAIYDRVEVVRGATGLTTGAGNPSAAINLVRKHATSKEFTGTAEVGIGRWDQRRAMVDLSTPLNEAGTVRARLVGEYQDGDSWTDLLSNKSKTIYATVEADLTPDTLLSAGFSRQETESKGPMWGSLPYRYSDGSLTNWDTSKTSAASWTSWDTSYNNAFVNLDHKFQNGWKVGAGYSHGDRKGDSHLLYQYGTVDRVTGLGMNPSPGSYLSGTKQDDFSLTASGPFQLGGRQHEAAFGYVYSKQKWDSDSRAADFGQQSTDIGDFNNWNGAAYATPTWGAPTFYESSVTKQESAYGVARFSLADPLKLIIGARLTNYDKTGHGIYAPEYQVKHDNEVTPYAGLVYDINDTYSAYGSYTSIFQPQNNKDINGGMLDPITGKSFEAGVKGEYFGGKLNASAAVFKIKQDKLAQEAGLVDRDGAGPLLPEIYYRAADGAESKGFEFELTGELARDWNFTAGYTQFKAEEANGDKFNSIYPRKLFRVFTTYRLPGDLNGLTVGGGVNFEGATDTLDPSALPGTDGSIKQDSFSIVNLMARYQINKNLSAQFNLDNAFDKTHFGMFAAYGGITYAAPRAARLSLRYKF